MLIALELRVPMFERKRVSILRLVTITSLEKSVFPQKPRKSCSVFKEKYGRVMLFEYVKDLAIAPLINELLHIKHFDDEEKVEF
jgi:hypothetical protein